MQKVDTSSLMNKLNKWNERQNKHLKEYYNKQFAIHGVVSSACKKAEIIEVLNNRRKQAFDNQFHKYENNEMKQAIDIINRLLPDD